jgi:hypothetical protein
MQPSTRSIVATRAARGPATIRCGKPEFGFGPVGVTFVAVRHRIRRKFFRPLSAGFEDSRQLDCA